MALNDDLNLSRLPELARSGLRNPRVETLVAGETIFRFASTSKPPALWAAGPWWIRERDYRRIISAYEAERGKHGEDALSLGFLGRAAVAVQHSWSKVDVVVKAQVVEDINVFAGRGQRQYREWLRANIYITLSGWPQIEQLFIPNLGDQNGLTELGRRALLVLRKKTITSTWF